MKKTILTPEQAVSLGLGEPWAYITQLSRVTVGPTPGECPLEELLEARFFGPRREIRIWHDGEALHALSLEDEEQEDFLDLSQSIRREQFGSKLTMRRYISYDEDGQAHIRDTRLLLWEGDA